MEKRPWMAYFDKKVGKIFYLPQCLIQILCFRFANKFFSFGSCIQKKSKTFSETCAKWSQFGAVSEKQFKSQWKIILPATITISCSRGIEPRSFPTEVLSPTVMLLRKMWLFGLRIPFRPDRKYLKSWHYTSSEITKVSFANFWTGKSSNCSSR